MSALDDYFARMMPDFERWIAEHGGQPLDHGQPTVKPVGEPLNAHKVTAYIEVPNELLMDAGLIPDTRPPRPPLPWRTRLRYRWADWREKAARSAFKVIAGYEVPEEDW